MDPRARLEASLGLHQAKIETLRQLESRLDARIARLGELSVAAKMLIDSIMANPFLAQPPEPEPPELLQPEPDAPEETSGIRTDGDRASPVARGGRSASRLVRRSVSWMSEPHEEVPLHHKEDMTIPAHGHWVPTDVLERRSSFQGQAAQKLGGRQVELQAGKLGSVSCILVEPMGKLLSADFISTGVTILFQGRRPDKPDKSMDEWVQVLKRTKLLDAGVSVALPDIAEEVDLQDLHCLVDAIMQACHAELCILCGKAGGALKAVEVAGRDGRDGRVAGAILLAPTQPPPVVVFGGPVMLVWAQDDKDAPFAQAEAWAQALAARQGVAVLRAPEQGGHDLARLFRKDEKAGSTDGEDGL